MKAGKKLVEIRGEKEFLRKHLLGCTFAPSDIKKKIAGPPDSASPAAKRSSRGDVSVAKRSAKQASMMGFMDRPLTDNGTLRFEKLLAEFFLDCNVAFKSVESPSLANLLNFLRPSVKLPSRKTFTNRIVKGRISEAQTEIEKAIKNQACVTLTFDGFKNVSKNKLLGKQ